LGLPHVVCSNAARCDPAAAALPIPPSAASMVPTVSVDRPKSEILRLPCLSNRRFCTGDMAQMSRSR